MKIVHLTTSFSGGAGIASVRVNDALNLVGIESRILSRDNYPESKKIKYIRRLKSSTNTIFQSKFVQNSNDLVTPFSVNFLEIQSKLLSMADIVHIHSYYNLLNHSFLKNLMSIPKAVFFTMHDQRLFTGGCHYSRDCTKYLNFCGNCPQVNIPFRSLIKKSFINQQAIFSNVANVRIISPSFWLKSIASESKILSKTPIRVIRNPIPKIFFDYPIISHRNSDSIRIAFVAANLDNPYKGFKTFAEAINKIALTNKRRITVVLIGKGGNKAFNSNVCVDKVLAQNNLEMAELLSSVDLLVVPSNQDNSPSVIGEALSMGVSVIGSRIGGITEILNEFGMPTFKVGAHDELSEKILEMGNFNQKKEIREKSKKYFSEELIANNLIEFYTEALV